MRRLVSSASALEADRRAEVTFGYPSLLLMEEAGIRLQDRLEALASQETWGAGPTVYLAGPGNNGGDARVMARQAFLRGRPGVVVVEALPPASENARAQARWGAQLAIPTAGWPSDQARSWLSEAAVWVDGLWGAGFRGPPRPDVAELLATLESLRREHRPRVVALDVPSGLWEGWSSGDPVLTAEWTLAPGWSKDFCFYPGLRTLVGQSVDVPLAFPWEPPASTELLEASDLADLVPAVDGSAHKGRRGHVAVWGGAPGMTGALVLASRSAAASGAGLVTLGTDPDLVSLVAPQVPAFQVRAPGEAIDLVHRFDAALAGPGWGRGEDRMTLLKALWETDLPLVVDADGLAAWSALGRPSRSVATVFTPHPGEFLRLGAGPATPEAASALAREKGITVVLKGAVTWILAPDGGRSVWDGANPALGTGGSGDCLAGVVAAFLASAQDPYAACRAAVVLHARAGAALADDEGWFTADRLPEALARAALACRTGRGRL